MYIENVLKGQKLQETKLHDQAKQEGQNKKETKFHTSSRYQETQILLEKPGELKYNNLRIECKEWE